MLAVIEFPNISPEIFSIDIGQFTFALRWYALAYIVGILIGWWLALRAIQTPRLWPENSAVMTREQVENLLTWIILGVIVGGRLGFVLFYQPEYYLANPGDIPKIWQGGMAFHGGFAGVVIAGLIFCWRNGISVLGTADMLALATAPALFLGRIANFINAELWGRPSTLPWAVIFPGEYAQSCSNVGELCARHPSQLYEAGMEGLILGTLILWLVWQRGWLKWPGQVAGVFIAGYGIARFIVEFFRQADAYFVTPDNPWGHVFLGMTRGQQLSLPMIVVGVALVVWARRRA